MIRRPPRSTLDRSSAASDVYKRQIHGRPGLADRAPQPKEDDRRLLFGLEPDEDDGLGLREVGVGHRATGGGRLLYPTPRPPEPTRTPIAVFALKKKKKQNTMSRPLASQRMIK